MPLGLSSSGPTSSGSEGEKPANCCMQCLSDGPCCRMWQSCCDSSSSYFMQSPLCCCCCCHRGGSERDGGTTRQHTRRPSAASEGSGSYDRELESCWWWCFMCDSSTQRRNASSGLRRYSSQATTLATTHSQRSLMITELLRDLLNHASRSQAGDAANSNTMKFSPHPPVDLPSRTWWKLFGGIPIGDEGLRLCAASLRRGEILDEATQFSSHHRIGDADAFSSPVVPAMNARRYESVASLELHDQNLSDVVASPLLYELLHDTFPNLTAISLCRNSLGSACAAVLGSHLRDKKRCRLKALHISGNPIGCEGFEKIVSACAACKSLQRLEIGDTHRLAISNFQFDDHTAHESGIGHSCSEIASNDCGPSHCGAMEALIHLFTAVPLKEFRLVGPVSWMKAQVVHEVIYSARCSSSLEELVLLDVLPVDAAVASGVQNRMYQSLSNLLGASTSLTKLTIRQNISTAGASCIADALSVAVALRYLSLSRCGLDSNGLKEISRGLALNRTLLHLDLSYPDASAAEAIHSVATALESNRTLQQLTITGMDTNEAMLQCLCNAVVRGGNKTLVSVVHSPCECDASHRLHSLLESNELQWKNTSR